MSGDLRGESEGLAIVYPPPPSRQLTIRLFKSNGRAGYLPLNVNLAGFSALVRGGLQEIEVELSRFTWSGRAWMRANRH